MQKGRKTIFFQSPPFMLKKILFRKTEKVPFLFIICFDNFLGQLL